MTDRELLELAAKAAGIELGWDSPFACIGDFAQFPYNKETGDGYDPLTDDGDALRLAVRLKLQPFIGDKTVTFVLGELIICEQHNQDPYAAVRRAIVRSAAEIGRRMK